MASIHCSYHLTQSCGKQCNNITIPTTRTHFLSLIIPLIISFLYCLSHSFLTLSLCFLIISSILYLFSSRTCDRTYTLYISLYLSLPLSLSLSLYISPYSMVINIIIILLKTRFTFDSKIFILARCCFYNTYQLYATPDYISAWLCLLLMYII